MEQFWLRMLDRRWWVLGLCCLVILGLAVGAGRIRQDTSPEASRAEHNPWVVTNQKINQEFGGGRSEVIVLHSPSIFVAERLVKIRRITEALTRLPGVKKVSSLTNASRIQERDGVLETGDLVPDESLTESQIADIQTYLETNFLFRDGLLVKEGKSANITVEMTENADFVGLAAGIEQVIRDHWTDGYDLAGVPTFRAASLEMMNRDVPLLAGLAFLVILAVFSLNFRSVIGVILPLIQITAGLVGGLGIFGWLGMPFQQLSIIAPIAILAVGSSFSLHLLGRYFLELSRGKSREAAVLQVLQNTSLGVGISGLAISVSLLTFGLSDIPMVRTFGLLCSLGVGMSTVAALTLLPVMMCLLPTPRVRVNLEASGPLPAVLSNVARWVGRHAKLILSTGLGIVLLASVGLFFIVPDTSAVSFFKPESRVMKGLNAINEAFGGSSAIQVLVEGDLQDPAVLQALLKFQEQSRSIHGIGPSVSIASLARSLHETLSGEPGFPSSRELVSQELLIYQSSGSVEDLQSLSDLGYHRGLVTLVVPQVSTQEAKRLLAALKPLAAQTIGPLAEYQFAGDILNEIALEEVLLHDFVISLTLALALVILIDSLIRSLRAALVTATVIGFTILLQYGVFGLFGLQFTVSTALLGALAIGVGDYAIHWTVRYMEDRRTGLTPEDAVVASLTTSGRSIVYTALTLAGGFSVLGISEFAPIAVLGQMMVLTVVLVGIASLTLLPAACVVFLRNPISHIEVNHAS